MRKKLESNSPTIRTPKIEMIADNTKQLTYEDGRVVLKVERNGETEWWAIHPNDDKKDTYCKNLAQAYLKAGKFVSETGVAK